MAVAEGVISPDDDCFKATFYHSPHTPPALLDAKLKQFRGEHRWDGLRFLPGMPRLFWDKLRP